MTPTLSVILPVASYNTEWLQEAINSVSLFRHQELIVVTDEATQFDVRLNHPNVTDLIMVQRTGTHRALNAGIATACGDYISIVCSDDEYIQRGMNTMVDVMETDVFDIIGGKVSMSGLFCGYWPMDNDMTNLEKQNNIAVAAIFRKSLWHRLSGFADVRYTDWHFWKRAILEHKASYYYTPQIFYHYRTWTGSGGAKIGYRNDLGHEYKEGDIRQ